MADVVDYSPHYLEVKKKMDQAHRLILEGKIATAVATLDEVLVELRLMRTAVNNHGRK